MKYSLVLKRSLADQTVILGNCPSILGFSLFPGKLHFSVSQILQGPLPILKEMTFKSGDAYQFPKAFIMEPFGGEV